MSQVIESLERRTLLTASVDVIAQDLGALIGAGTTAKADLAAKVKEIAGDVKSLKSAAAAAKPTAAQKKLLAGAQKDVTKETAAEKKKLSAILGAGTRDGAKLVAALKAFKAHPTDTATVAKAQAALTALAAVFSTQVITTAESDAAAAVTKVNADLDAVGTALPAAQPLIATVEGHLAADLTLISTDATAIQTGISTLSADLA